MTRKLKTIEEPLPKGWKRSEWSERRMVLTGLPKRVRVLLTIEWARSVLPIFESRYPNDIRPRKAIESAENWVSAADAAAAGYDTAAAAADAADAAATAAAATAAAATAAVAGYDAADDADVTAADAAAGYDAAADAKKKWLWLYKTFKHAKGPNYVFNRDWMTSTVILLARQIFDERAFDRMPILADALQDAGFSDLEMILHLQNDHEEFTRADWVLCSILGYDKD